jgi:hypothetical protein
VHSQQKQTNELVFADAKEKHAMRYTQYRGLQKVTMQVALTFACMNLKKLAAWKRRMGKFPPLSPGKTLRMAVTFLCSLLPLKKVPHALRETPFYLHFK